MAGSANHERVVVSAPKVVLSGSKAKTVALGNDLSAADDVWPTFAPTLKNTPIDPP